MMVKNKFQPKCPECHSFVKMRYDPEFNLKKDGAEVLVAICKRCGYEEAKVTKEKGLAPAIKRFFKRTDRSILIKYRFLAIECDEK